MQTRIDDYAAGLLERMKRVVGEVSLSEVARRTGTPFASLHRYFHGTKVPAEFLAAFARAFEVNPAWLLHGEGAPLLADVSAVNARLGGDLLELVEAMNAVTRMRLGALTGKHHLKVLRELSDAMQRFGDLRGRLDAQSQPIFRDLLAEFDKQLRRRQLDRAAELRRALDQVSLLSGNEELHERFEALQGLQAHVERDFETAIAFHRRSMMRALAKGAEFTRAAAEHGGSFVVALRDYGRMEEAHRFAQAMLALMRGREDLADAIAWIEAYAGSIEVDLLRVGDALSRVARVLPGAIHDLRREGAGVWVRPSLWAGTARFEEMLEWGNNLPRKTRFLVRYANWREQPEWLELMLKRFVADEPLKLKSGDADARHAARLLAALKGERDPKFAPEPVQTPVAEFRDAVFEAQLALARNDAAAARKRVQEADRLLAALPAGITPDLEYHATHYRNVLRAGGKGLGDLKQRAEQFFERLLQGGCLEARFVLEPEAPRP